MTPPGPERTKGWIGLLLPLFERGGPVVSLLLLCTLLACLWHFLGEVRRLRTLGVKLYEERLVCERANFAHLERIAAYQAGRRSPPADE